MTRGTRILLSVVIGGVLLLIAAVGATAAAVYRAGTISVDFQEDAGERIRVSVPAGLVGAAIALAPSSLLEEAAEELRPVLPAVRAGWEELVDAPDFTLVEVQSDEESVRVEKVGSRLHVLVDAPDATVQVSLPLDTVDALLRKLD